MSCEELAHDGIHGREPSHYQLVITQLTAEFPLHETHEREDDDRVHNALGEQLRSQVNLDLSIRWKIASN